MANGIPGNIAAWAIEAMSSTLNVVQWVYKEDSRAVAGILTSAGPLRTCMNT